MGSIDCLNGKHDDARYTFGDVTQATGNAITKVTLTG